MAIHKAIKFINAFKEGNEFRMELYKFNPGKEFTEELIRRGFNFTYDDLGNACRSISLKCSTEEEAADVGYILYWYHFMSCSPDS